MNGDMIIFLLALSLLSILASIYFQHKVLRLHKELMDLLNARQTTIEKRQTYLEEIIKNKLKTKKEK